MTIHKLTDPDQITAHLRLLKIYQRQRVLAGTEGFSLQALNDEAVILARLLEVDTRMMSNRIGEIIARKSIEGE